MEIGVSMKNKLLIGVGLGLIVGLTFLGLTVGIKNKNTVEETTEVASDSYMHGTSDSEVYATRFTGYRLVPEDVVKKVKSWLSSIDASGEVELISYDADSGDLQFIIDGESKTATIK